MEDFEVLTDGTDTEELGTDDMGGGTWYGTGAGNTIILPVTATPSPVPADSVVSDLQQNEEVNRELLNTLEKINEHLEENGENTEGTEQESVDGLDDPEAPEEENSEEPDKTLNDIYVQLESISASLESEQEYAMIHYQNSELIETFILGFLVASFFAFIIFCFLNKVR